MTTESSAAMTFLVNEIYRCLQGEGPNLGVPALLVRFQICNLRCTWCDTPYTHTIQSDPISPGQKKGAQFFRRYTLQELVSTIHDQTKNSACRHLILTGGEPTLQNMGVLMRALGDGFTAEVESNGTRIPHLQLANFQEEDYLKMQWNISPKFSNAGETLITESLAHWASLAQKHTAVFFKFVIRKSHSSDDCNQVLQIVKNHRIDQSRVILMPEGTTVESQIHNTWLADICMQHGFRYSPRLHILLFDNLRGV